MNICYTAFLQQVYGKTISSIWFCWPFRWGALSGQHCLRTIARFVPVLCLVLVCTPALADDKPLSEINYRLGDGLHIPGSPLTLGGYSTVSYDHLDGSAPRLALDNLSLFLWWETDGGWKYFSELDYEGEPLARSSEEHGDDHYLSLERLFADYAFDATTNVRIGKFLTPIGRWNLIHATPLVWTSSRPLVTSRIFPTNMTGMAVLGTEPERANGLEYTVYVSDGNELLPNPAINTFEWALGGHVLLPLASTAKLGFSYASFAQESRINEKKQLFGTDFFWSHNRYEVSAEGAYRYSGAGGQFAEKGVYVQLVAPLSEKLYAVGRYEAYHMARSPELTKLWVSGVNYRITPAIVLKAEWISAVDDNHAVEAQAGFLSSLCVLF